MATDCPGTDTECQKRTCTAGNCGISYTPANTVITDPIDGDCKKVTCDGAGNSNSVDDDTDLPNDDNPCTTDSCLNGVAKFTNVTPGGACNQNGGKVCKAGGVCVQCLVNSDCTSQVCNSANQCVAAQCTDSTKNGTETDTDCGGASCPKCGLNKACLVNSDCIGGTCTSGKCAATCSDGVKDQTESDTDCGGPCSACPTGEKCSTGADCQSGKCTAGVCADVLVLSQVQTRGSNGGNDEFVEIYNPTSIPVTFSGGWSVTTRSAAGVTSDCTVNMEAVKFFGQGQIIPAHHHILYVNNSTPGYDGAVPGDGTYTAGINDASSLILRYNGTVVDALCFYIDSTTRSTLATCSTGASPPYTCEGTPISNLPHDNTTGGTSNTDVSLERRPGGAQGNGMDTGDSTADFVSRTSPTPHNLASAATP